MARELEGHRHGDTKFADVRTSNRVYQVTTQHVLQKVTHGSRPQRLASERIIFVCRENDDPCFRPYRPNRNGGVDAAQHGHPDVHQRDVGAVSQAGINSLSSVGSFVDELHVRLSAQQARYSFPKHRMIVNGENSNLVAMGGRCRYVSVRCRHVTVGERQLLHTRVALAAARSRSRSRVSDRTPASQREPGSRTTRRTRVPRSFSLVILKRAAIKIARSRMPINPQWPGRTGVSAPIAADSGKPRPLSMTSTSRRSGACTISRRTTDALAWRKALSNASRPILTISIMMWSRA